MSRPDNHSAIERALRHPLSPIPGDLQNAFKAYQLEHCRRFLLIINLLGQAAYFSYGLADLILIPDVATVSIGMRTAILLLTLPPVLIIIRRTNNVQLLDLILPTLIVFAAFAWLELLQHSASTNVSRYQYASLIFIVLANLCIQVRFLPSVLTSSLISLVILRGVFHSSHGDMEEMLVFLLVYLPVLFFSLFIAWSTTLDKRRAFLRSMLNDITHEALSEANAKLQKLADTDMLTGASNRRVFEIHGHREVARAERHRQPLSMLLFDVDHFKRINDTYGHDIGDKVLQALCTAAQLELREHDLLARIGGEEFAALLPDTTLAAAQHVAERLRQSLSACRVPVDQQAEVRFTVSIGVSHFCPQAFDLNAMVKAADKALYHAKHNGRDQICLMEAEPSLPPILEKSPLGDIDATPSH